MKNKIATINKSLATALTIFVFLATIVVVGILYVNNLKKASKAELEMIKMENMLSKSKGDKLEACLEKAKKNANDTFLLNSSLSPQEGFPDARNWDNMDIKHDVEDEYRADQDFCIKLYK